MLSRVEIAQRINTLPPDMRGAAAKYALQVYGPAPQAERFKATRYDPASYIKKHLKWDPWNGSEEHPGQREVIEAYVLALRQQHERKAYEDGEIDIADLRYWKPGQVIKNRIRLEAGHTVGKTKLCSGLVNHFFDHFTPSIIYTFAPTYKQIKDLLWKEIKTDRRGKGLPGKINDLEIKVADNHFANGTATNDAGGRGTERIQGQHGEYLMFVLDEAEGIPDFVYNAVDSTASGGISIVLMPANPRTRSSRFHKVAAHSNVGSFRISCLYHPNVIQGREVVPGAVKRQYVEEMIEKHCEIVSEHNEDDHTFDLPYAVRIGDESHSPGTIFKPNAEFMFRVMGIAPANLANDTFISVGRFEAACKRQTTSGDKTRARMGVDVSRYGVDFGTLYIRHDNVIWRAAQFWKQDTNEYARVIKEEALKLARLGVESLQIRVDGGGGFGGGVIDKIKNVMELKEAFKEYRCIEINFGGSPSDKTAYDDHITEMYAEAAETLKGVRVRQAPEALEQDLCERKYKFVNRSGIDVKKLEPKEEVRKPTRLGRSPDDGDGFVMCAAPDRLFPNMEPRRIEFRI